LSLPSLLSITTDNNRPAYAAQAEYYNVDLRNPEEIDAVFNKYKGDEAIWGVVHLAALKAVGESGEIPLSYYRVNMAGTISLLEVCPCWCIVPKCLR
jgi:UDP-glucose 4-epimerase